MASPLRVGLRDHPSRNSVEPSASKRILVAEDDAATRMILKRHFRDDEGVEIDIVDDGLQALQAIHAGRFDSAIIDLHLPGADGWEILRSLDDDAPKNKPRLIVCSGSDLLPQEEQELHRLGAKFVSKDGSLKSLRRLRALALHDSADEDSAAS